MIAILIDVKKCTAEEVSTSGSLEDMYKLIGCTCFAIARYFGYDDCCYVDDEGLLLGKTEAFRFTFDGGYSQPFVGNGLIMGSDAEGRSCDVKMGIEDVSIEFGNVEYLPSGFSWVALPKALKVKMSDVDVSDKQIADFMRSGSAYDQIQRNEIEHMKPLILNVDMEIVEGMASYVHYLAIDMPEIEVIITE